DDRFRLLTRGSRAAPARQQTLRATLDWSYALLANAEQHLFDDLSIFAGGWSLEAMEAVSNPGDGEAADVVGVLGALVDKSLVRAEQSAHGPVRYRLLETLRQYGQEHLRARAHADAVASRHAVYFTEFSEKAAADFFGPRGPLGLAALDSEHEN